MKTPFSRGSFSPGIVCARSRDLKMNTQSTSSGFLSASRLSHKSFYWPLSLYTDSMRIQFQVVLGKTYTCYRFTLVQGELDLSIFCSLCTKFALPWNGWSRAASRMTHRVRAPRPYWSQFEDLTSFFQREEKLKPSSIHLGGSCVWGSQADHSRRTSPSI